MLEVELWSAVEVCLQTALQAPATTEDRLLNLVVTARLKEVHHPAVVVMVRLRLHLVEDSARLVLIQKAEESPKFIHKRLI